MKQKREAQDALVQSEPVTKKTKLPKKAVKEEPVEEENFDVDVENVDENQKQTEKKDRKTVRLEQKQLAQERRAKRSHAELIDGLRHHWDTIRQKSVETKDKQEPIASAMLVIKGSIVDLSLKRDASRMIQTIINYAGESVREAIAQEIKDNLQPLVQNMYAIHVVNKLIKESPAARDILISSLKGKVDRFFKTKGGCAFLDELYRSVNATKRMSLFAELYSRAYALPNANGGISLSEMIATNPARREFILQQTKQRVEALLQRKLMNFQCAQRLLNDYLSNEVPAKLTEMSERFLEHIEVMTDYKEGCEAIVRIIAVASAKERKALVKTCKGMMGKLMTEGANRLQIILALFSFVDDTVLVGKAIVQEICKDLETVFFSRISSKAILMLLSGAQGHLVTSPVAALLKEVDPLAAATSKKDAAVRRQELQEYLMPPLRAFIQENFDRMVNDDAARAILIEFLAVVPQEEACSLVTSYCQRMGSLSAAFAMDGGEAFIRAAVKRSESLSNIILTVILSEGLTAHLNGKSGFLLAIMTRYASLAETLKTQIETIRSVDTEVTKILLTKLQQQNQ